MQQMARCFLLALLLGSASAAPGTVSYERNDADYLAALGAATLQVCLSFLCKKSRSLQA